MPISTNSIIHYTDTIENLESIIKEGLAIKYCSERLIMEKYVKSSAAHPLISFCDIPLSNSYKHFSAYGRYGIGLSKAWAKRNGVNPVLYLDDDSSISKTFGELIKERRKESSNLTEEQKNSILRIKCFAKNYSGPLKRKSVNETNYRFYDEREWRLVPEKNELLGANFSVNIKLYEADKETYNKVIATLRFTFDANEISYIIVDKTSEIPRIIEVIRNSFSSKCTAQQLEILYSKVCSTEQILSDY